MNRLKFAKFYLAGPIRKGIDFISWRKDMSNFLWSIGAGVLDPCDKPLDHHEDEFFQDKLLRLKSEGKYDTLASIVREVVTIDLHLVDLSTAVILHIDTDVHMQGSYAEMTYACLERKPLIVHAKNGKKNLPAWVFGHAKHELFFDTWDEIKDYLNHIDKDKIVDTLNNRWKFLDYNKIYGFR